MPEETEESIYLKFIDLGFEVAKSIKRYFSKYSNKIFCNHQHIVLLVLRQKLCKTYREFIEFLKVSSVPLYIGLKRIPHYTTLQKFAKKFNETLLTNLGLNCISLVKPKKLIIGIDGTGFTLENASKYYSTIACRATRNGEMIIRNKFMQLSIAADLDNQLILTSSLEKRKSINSKGLIELVKPINDLKNGISYVTADKGYDTNKNHEYIIQNIKCKCFIKVRNYSKRKHIPKNPARIYTIAHFDEKKYHQRSKVETIFSVLKRRYGSGLNSKNEAMQKKELLFRILAYNLDRLVKLTSLIT